jgi:hypothetical protein
MRKAVEVADSFEEAGDRQEFARGGLHRFAPMSRTVKPQLCTPACAEANTAVYMSAIGVPCNAFRGRDHRHRSKLTADRMLRAVGHTPMGNCYFPFGERHATTAGLREARSLRHLGRQPPTVLTAGTGWLPHPTKEKISLRRRIKWDPSRS